ncbi:leucine--tRNA ligase [Trichonephila clavata]|uniref:leucine--tRNA ligase n=1 Tax=Trichonephila clavata TaxID=2740835 RepID=A0A8X6GTP3_TRICU|nr:leucine--tRNA ligase [Trichonephila clavata]
MSKSKKNTVDPNFIIEKYGADTARLFVLSDTPPEKDMEWCDDGVEGCSRYVNKLWRYGHAVETSESLWQGIGGQPWPKADESLLVDDTVTIAVQINGKLRTTIKVAINLPQEELKKIAIDSVSSKIDQSKVRTVYAVPNKIVNIVI